MGKAARRAKGKRAKSFAVLFRTDPQSFQTQWEGLLSAWLMDIQRNAGKLKDQYGQVLPPGHAYIDEALHILRVCGDRAYSKYAHEAYEILSAQYNKAFSQKCLPQFYKVSSGHNNWRWCERPAPVDQENT